MIKNTAFSFYRGGRTAPSTILREVYTDTSVSAGAETTEFTIKGMLLAMSLYPEVQATAQAELDRVVGDRLPTVDDMGSLPYIMAILIETLRWCPPATVGGSGFLILCARSLLMFESSRSTSVDGR